MSAAWRVPVRDRDIETHLGLHDFDIQMPDGPEAMEVTTATSQDLRALYANLEDKGLDLGGRGRGEVLATLTPCGRGLVQPS